MPHSFLPSHPVLSVIVPVCNGGKNVTALLDKINRSALSVPTEIILVSDGSAGSSPEICREWIEDNRSGTRHALKLLHSGNDGIGAAVKTGIQESSGAVILIPDADAEYDPEDFTRCITPILHGECKVVYGSRKAGSRSRMFSNPLSFPGGLLLTGWIDLLYNSELTDASACCKTFDGPLLRSIPVSSGKFNWESEITAKLLRLGFEIREVPISCHSRTAAEGKKMKWTAWLHALWTALFWRFAPVGGIRRRTGELSASCREIIRKHRNTSFLMTIVFMIAFLIRLLGALPGFSSPQLLMRPESTSFLTAAGPGIFTSMPAFHKPYPSAWRKWKPDTPRFQKVYGNETRAPLYPLWLSMLFGISGHSLPFAAAAGCLLGALACIPVMLAGRLFGSSRIGIAAGLLLAVNPTAIVSSPLFLPDTLFLLFVSMQVWFFLRFVKNGFGLNLAASVILAAFGALVSPCNAWWIIPCTVTLLLLHRIPLKKRLFHMLTALLLCGAVLLPWLHASRQAGIGWRIDTAGAWALMKNTAAMEAAADRRKKSDVIADYRAQMHERYSADPVKFSTLGAQLDEQEKFLFRKILRHPFRTLSVHFNPAVLQQDMEGFFLNLGIFRPKRFHVKLLYCASILLSMLAALGLGWYFIAAADQKNGCPVLLFLLFAGYYLLLPGSAAIPRHQLPALPYICLAAAFGLFYFFGIIKEKKTPSGL